MPCDRLKAPCSSCFKKLDCFILAECRPMVSENRSCLFVTPRNGDCGCAGGLTCRYFQERDTLRMPYLIDVPYINVDGDARIVPRSMAATDPMATICVPT